MWFPNLPIHVEIYIYIYYLPSVGILPPTPNPKKKSIKHKLQKLKAKLDKRPIIVAIVKVDVYGVLRPRESEYAPQKNAPNIIPVNNELDRLPIQLSDTPK